MEPTTLPAQEPSFLGGTSRAAAILSALLAAMLMVVVATVPIRSDNDCWWHVKSGQLILERLAAGEGLPKTDPFSFTAADHEWHNHEWLTQAAMALVFNAGEATGLGGWRAVILATTLVLAACTLVLWALAGRLSGNWWIALLVAALAVAIGRRTYYPRPPVLSNLLLAGLLCLLIAVAQGKLRPRWLLVLPPVFALWTNLHGAWMAGIVVLVAFLAGDVLARMKLVPLPFEAPPAPLRPLRAALLFGAVLLATLCNPYGWRLYELPARVLSDRELVASIGELQPPNLNFTRIFESFLFAVIAGALLARRLRVRFAELAIFIFFLHQGLQHVRHLLLFSVMMVPLASRLFGSLLAQAREALEATFPSETRRVQRVLGGATLALALAVCGLTLANWPLTGDAYPRRFASFWQTPDGYLKDGFPAALCDFVELAGLEGRMFNENHYAGYLIWRLSPDTHKVFSDPRFDIFGGTIWREEAQVAGGVEFPGEPDSSWRGILDRWDVQWAIVGRGSGLHQRLLEDDAGWVLVADFSTPRQRIVPSGGRQVWIRDTPANAAQIERARRTFAATFGALP